jgi:outer membrane protein assembly factor BamB
MIRILLCVLGSVISSDRMERDDGWTRFRGPNGTGVVEGVSFPVTWTDEDYAWSASLPGKGHSSPVIWGDQLYVTCADSETGDVVLIALDVASGKFVWEVPFDLDPYPTHATNSLASCTAAVDAAHVYLPLVSPEAVTMVALSHAGQEVWRRDFGPYDAHHGSGIAPIVFDDKVILACDHDGESFVVALAASSGETVWRTPRTPCKASYATPAVWESPAGEQQLVFHSTSEGMVGVAPETGKVLWQLADLFPERCVSSPLVAGGLVFGGSGAGSNGVSLVCVKPGNAAGSAAEVVYDLRKSVPQIPTPLAYEGMLFVLHDRGTIACRDLRTGDEHWTKRIGGQYYSSPICAGSRIYCLADSGEVVVLAAAKEFEELGRAQLPGISRATPAVADGRMFLRTESAIMCLSAE